jgi:hypothetical protein
MGETLMAVTNLDSPCGVCARASGDHTLREWAACLGTTTLDLPYQPVAADITSALRERFNLPGDQIIADHVVVRAAVLGGHTGVVGVKSPIVLHEFAVGMPDRPAEVVAKVAYIGSGDAVRAYGRLVQESADGAAAAAER